VERTSYAFAHRNRENIMLRIVVAASLIASGDALNVPVAGMSRRAAFAKAAALIPLVPLAAFAELKQASDADVYARADAGKLNAARVIERAKAGKLVNGASATCDELADILAIDRRAFQFEKDKLASMPNDPEQKKVVADAEKAIEAQIKKLEGLEKSKSCAGLKQASDAEVYERADDNKLGYARVIEREHVGSEARDGAAELGHEPAAVGIGVPACRQPRLIRRGQRGQQNREGILDRGPDREAARR
jgi:hypothetical protein